MKIQKQILSGLLILVLLSMGAIFSIITPSTYIVFGANISNITSQVNVTNTVPWVTNVMVDDSTSTPVGEIDLNPGSTVNVWCNGTVHDGNGWNDISGANATFYYQSKNPTDSPANSSLYIDTSCYNITQDTLYITYMCNLTVAYYAWNGTWTCNLTGYDGIGLKGSNLSTTYVNELYAIDVPGVIDYGQMEVNTNSTDETQKNVTNYGNMVLDLELYGFARAIDDGFAMNCTNGATIPIANEFFDINASNNTMAFKTALSGTQASPNQVNFNLDLRNDSNGYDYTSVTDWKLFVPYGIAGWCNGRC